MTEHRVLVCFYSYVSVSAGIGQGRVTDNLNGAPVDRAILVKNSEAVAMVCNTLCACTNTHCILILHNIPTHTNIM